MRYLFIISALLLCCISTATIAQQKKVLIQGTVIDKKEKVSIPGVNILSGTPLASVGMTNEKGEFSVSVLPDAKLVFSYVGYTTVTQKLDGKTKLTIFMNTSASYLNETVVVGYQTKSKILSTGSSVVITGKQIQDVPAGNAMELLQGKVAGLNIQNNNGMPGMRGSINIRGLSNINVSGAGDNAFLTPTSPLFVIDGVPIDDNSSYEYGFQQAGPGISPVSLIPTEDIERIEVLKDAQATSLYGSKGAYGVILITTKRGNSKIPIVSYTSKFFMNTVPQLRKVIGGRDERMMRIDQILRYDTSYYHGLGMINNSAMLSDSLNAYWNNSTDWQSYFYRQTFNQSHNVDISGGDQLFNYKVNVGSYAENGILENTGFTRYNLNMNMQYQPSPRFKLFASINNALGKNSVGSGNGLLQTGVATGGSSSSLLPAPSQFSAVNDLLASLKTQNDNKTVNTVTTLDIQYEFIKGLRASTNFSYNFNTATEDTFRPSSLSNGGGGQSTYFNERRSTVYNRNMLSYFKTLNDKHNFTAYVFNEINMNKAKADKVRLVSNVSDYIQGPYGYGFYNSRGGTLDNFADARSVAFAGAFTYNYDQKYVIDLTYRVDGTSTNGPDAGYSKNPSIGLRWNFFKENLFKDFNWLDYASLKASYGKNINPNGSIYDVYGKYLSGPAYNNNTTVSLDKGVIPNTGLLPTTTMQLNAGFEMGIYKDRLSFTFDTYYKQVDNILRSKAVANINSFGSISTNETSLVNYGYEFSMRGRPLSEGSKVNWTLSFNGAINKDVLTHLPNGDRELIYDDGRQLILYRLGMNSLSNVLYNTKGVYATSGAVPVDPLTGLRYRTAGGNPAYFQAGDPYFTDLNGDYILDNNDLVVVGNSQPRFVGGLGSFAQYKGFSLNMNFSFTLGRDIINNALADRLQNFSNPTAPGAMVPLNEYNSWQNPGDIADFPNGLDFTRQARVQPFRYNQTLFQEDGSYLKLNDVTLSYNLNRKFTQRYGMNSLRIYGTAKNLHTFSNYSGPNPENVSALGRDTSGGYPNSRSYTLGLSVQF
ncbi:SusC/RagA family TonB-linked outer membrane protein [Pedobacter gandavensis]|uniref:SusC/RagA family TonB-linked outer membrane protein n=1 Tax=Pedobacter gandavensis TaxID=2679963 RepID=A0ABR6EXQ6_9SPHI|nr:SusC/RagA family TonB-linked outer membrane protein [Pedobacter gandavensis]MBB2150036.1 SusC/RagA family TonB-linked outer membrane protein [Pedobacter gandavensis]